MEGWRQGGEESTSKRTKKSWTKTLVISQIPRDDFDGFIWPIKVFEDGDILITKEGCSRLLCYSSKTKTIGETDLIEFYGHYRTSAVSYTSSFLPLETFTMEDVNSF